MAQAEPRIDVRFADAVEQLDAVEPLWDALQEHHARLTPNLGGHAPRRELTEAWRRRRAKYQRWLDDSESFFVVAQSGGRPIGYAFVTVGPGFASWETRERIAELQTLSVLPEHQGIGVGTRCLRRRRRDSQSTMLTISS
jgi:GNAT superfamily N-acetyltransferase